MADELLDFDEIEKQRYENLSFAKRLVLCSFTEILFQRKLLPNDAFKAIRMKGVKLFVFDASHDDAYENLVKLSKICDEIESEAVKTLRFVVIFSEDGKERIGEVFEIHLSYGENITVSLKLGDSLEHFRYDARSDGKDFQVFIMRLRKFCRMLRVLPDGSYGRYHIVYNNGKKMQDSGSDYFTKVIRAPLAWIGPKQEICAIVGALNKKEIGIKMSVGTLFGTGATDSMALAESLKVENWNEDDWDVQKENAPKRIEHQDHSNNINHVSYRHEIVDVGQDAYKTHFDVFEWHDEIDFKLEENEQNKKKYKNTKERASTIVTTRTLQIRRERALKEEQSRVHTSDDGYGDVELYSNDSAQRGSDIDSSAVMEVSEEANEKEGRMEMRRKRKKRMMERNDATWVSRGDIEKKLKKTSSDGHSTPTSSDSIVKTPGMSKKRSIPKHSPVN